MAANTLQSSNRPPDFDDEEEEDSGYFDMMMIGRTGIGKSTVGNKLLDIDPETSTLYGAYRVGEDITNMIKKWGLEENQKPYFESSDGRETVTKRCKVLSNEKTKDRVIDTRGFADTDATQRDGVLESNLQSFRWILQAQKAHDLRFSRVLYFLPQRGPPERADGSLQEEIKVMHGYFGQQIFDVMVIVATNNKRDNYQRAGFNQEDFAQVREVFMSAFHKVTTGSGLPKCPPVIYIPFNEVPYRIMEKVLSAEVISDAKTLYFPPEGPAQSCGTAQGENSLPVQWTVDMPREEKKRILRTYHGKYFQFEDRCTRCAAKIVQERLPSGEEVQVGVVDETGSVTTSHCHVFFIPKHSKFVKFVGGAAHIVTLGMGKVYEKISKKKSWPWFRNSDEKCVNCEGPPGSKGCSPVNQYIEIQGGKYMVTHSRELDTLQLLEEE